MRLICLRLFTEHSPKDVKSRQSSRDLRRSCTTGPKGKSRGPSRASVGLWSKTNSLVQVNREDIKLMATVVTSGVAVN
ncbi:hypothetical protein DPMN_178973 [Dreissena polymorpha]|uniref:Uncharacterized protein n=1 Tax=Dreissena polymorpha TaxID=45954 RepID=A0A9D4ED49_DREPO|nr:hypothetical protein DPMN_178973 [Dreissena polymorpha]